MTGDELKQCFDIIGWSARQAEQRWGLSGNMVQRMVNGKRPIPESVAQWARKLAATFDELGTPSLS
jgi:hypothetical protein